MKNPKNRNRYFWGNLIGTFGAIQSVLLGLQEKPLQFMASRVKKGFISLTCLIDWANGTDGTCGTNGTVACDYLVPHVPCVLENLPETRQVKDIIP